MTIYLYVKTHNETGLKYLGKTTSNPETYKGSGKYWKRHIQAHGYNVTTNVIYETSCPNDLKSKGLYYSKLWNIVDSEEWANLKPEDGDGGTHIVSEEQKKQQSEKMKGRYVGKDNPMFGKSRPDLSTRNKLPKAWVTDGTINKLILLEELGGYIDMGYARGRN